MLVLVRVVCQPPACLAHALSASPVRAAAWLTRCSARAAKRLEGSCPVCRYAGGNHLPQLSKPPFARTRPPCSPRSHLPAAISQHLANRTLWGGRSAGLPIRFLLRLVNARGVREKMPLSKLVLERPLSGCLLVNRKYPRRVPARGRPSLRSMAACAVVQDAAK